MQHGQAWFPRRVEQKRAADVRGREARLFFRFTDWELALIIFAVVFGVTLVGLFLGRRSPPALRDPAASRSASCREPCSGSWA